MTTTFSTRIQDILRILASGRTLAVMLSPPVSSLSVARNHRPLRSATRPWGLPALKFSDKCQVHQQKSVCWRVVRACTSLRILFCLANPLGSYFWKLSGMQNLTNKCVVLDIHLCAFGSHWRKATRLVFGEQSDRTCSHSLFSCRFRCHGKEGHKHLLLQGNLKQQSAKCPPRVVAF